MLDAIHRLFNNPALRKVLVKSRVLLGVAAVAAIIWYMDPRWLVPGFLVSMFGEAIQLWCFASLDKNSTLTARGPYTMVRNPMYLGRFFILLGFLMLLGNPWLLGVYAIGYWFYMDPRVRREEALLVGRFGGAYLDYAEKTSRFVPLPRFLRARAHRRPRSRKSPRRRQARCAATGRGSYL